MILEWSPEEIYAAKKMNEAVVKMVEDLLESDPPQSYKPGWIGKELPDGRFQHLEPKNDFQKGVAEAIGILRHLVHCMNPL